MSFAGIRLDPLGTAAFLAAAILGGVFLIASAPNAERIDAQPSLWSNLQQLKEQRSTTVIERTGQPLSGQHKWVF